MKLSMAADLQYIKTYCSLVINIWMVAWSNELYFWWNKWIPIRKFYFQFVVKACISLQLNFKLANEEAKQ